MRVLFVINTLSSGGAEKFVQTLFNELYKKGIDTKTIIVKNIIKRELLQKPTVLMNIQKKPFYIPTFIYEKMVLRKLYEKIKEINPDIIISNLKDSNIRVAKLKRFFGINQKLIFIEHVPSYLYKEKEIKEIKDYYKEASLIVGVSKKLIKDFDKYGLKNYVIIENGIDINKIQELSKENINVEKPYLVGVGRLSIDKGFDILIKAFKDISKEFENLKLYILGEGEDKNKLSKLIKALSLEKKVFLMGFKENPYPYIKNSEIFISPSRRESFSLASLEAMALKKAIITTEEVPYAKDRENALLVEKENPTSIYRATKELLTNKALKEYLEENAYKTAKDYSLEKMVERYEEILKF